MTEPSPRSGRSSSVFLIAAIALPLVVVGVFLVASAIPRWTVAPPEYDLLFRGDSGYNPGANQTFTTFVVREGRVVAEVRPAQANTYPPQPSLFLFDHETLGVTEVRLELPSRLDEGEASRFIPVAGLANRRVLDGVNAPDGYAFDNRSHGGAGLVGDIFGMNRYSARVAIAKGGRVIPIAIPDAVRYSVQPVGWLAPEGQ